MSGKTLRNLDLNLMVVFEAIFAAGSISHAAANLGMTQPAVSNALARLRALLDDQLFVRSGSGVEPTQKARQMVGPIREALKLIGGQVNPAEIDLSTYQRHFRIIIGDPIEAVVMPRIINEMAVVMPKVTIESLSAFRTDFVAELTDGTVDLACHVFPTPSPDLETEQLGPNDIVVVARRGHPAFRKPLSPEAFSKLPFMTLVPELRQKIHVEQNLASQGVHRNRTYVVNMLWSVPPMVEATDLISMLPRWFARHVQRNFAIEIHEPPVPLPEQHTFMTWHVRNNDDPGHRWLRQTLVQTFRAATADPKLTVVKA